MISPNQNKIDLNPMLKCMYALRQRYQRFQKECAILARISLGQGYISRYRLPDLLAMDENCNTVLPELWELLGFDGLKKKYDTYTIPGLIVAWQNILERVCCGHIGRDGFFVGPICLHGNKIQYLPQYVINDRTGEFEKSKDPPSGEGHTCLDEFEPYFKNVLGINLKLPALLQKPDPKKTQKKGLSPSSNFDKEHIGSLKKKGAVWELIFEDCNPIHLKDSLGLGDVAFLLEHPAERHCPYS